MKTDVINKLKNGGRISSRKKKKQQKKKMVEKMESQKLVWFCWREPLYQSLNSIDQFFFFFFHFFFRTLDNKKKTKRNKKKQKDSIID